MDETCKLACWIEDLNLKSCRFETWMTAKVKFKIWAKDLNNSYIKKKEYKMNGVTVSRTIKCLVKKETFLRRDYKCDKCQKC